MPTATKTRAKLRPTAPAGVPYTPKPQQTPMIRVPEPVTAVGDLTGKPYWRMGDNPNGPETINVTPPAGGAKPGRALMGEPLSMAQGGSAVVGYDPLALEEQRRRELVNAQRATLPTAGRALDAQAGVLGATAQTFAPRRAVIGAERDVIGGQERQTAGRRELIGSQLGENALQRSAEMSIQQAQANTADQAAVAQAQQARDSRSYIYEAIGRRPIEIATPNGADATLPAGTRAVLKTQAELLTEKEANRQKLSRLDLAAKSLGVDLLGLDVDGLRQVAARAGLTLDEVNVAVDEARNRAGYAKLDDDRANLNVERARIDVDEARIRPAGMEVYTNPVTGVSQYVTKATADQLDNDYRRQRELMEPSTVLYRDPYNAAAPRYVSQAEKDVLDAQYRRDLATNQAVANDQARNRQAAAVNRQSQYAGLSEGQLLGGIRDGTISTDASLQAVYQELIRRGDTPEQAQLKVDNAVSDAIRAKSGGGNSFSGAAR